MRNKPHAGQCQYDFPLVARQMSTSEPRKTVSVANQDRGILVCCLNPEHKMYLYKTWRESTLKEMLGLGCLVGEALKETILMCSQDTPAKLLSGTDEWDF